MLNERQVMLVVSSAMSKYSARNNGKRGLAKEDIIATVAQFGGDAYDVHAAMVMGIKRVAPSHHIFLD